MVGWWSVCPCTQLTHSASPCALSSFLFLSLSLSLASHSIWRLVECVLWGGGQEGGDHMRTDPKARKSNIHTVPFPSVLSARSFSVSSWVSYLTLTHFFFLLTHTHVLSSFRSITQSHVHSLTHIHTHTYTHTQMSFPQESILNLVLALPHCQRVHGLHSPGHSTVAELPVAGATVAKHGEAGRVAAVCGAGERTGGRVV